MDKESILNRIEGWGYRVLSKPHEESPGYTELLAAIREEPTEEHFDPERLRLCLRDSQGDVEWKVASWQVPVEKSGRVCPGVLILRDRGDREVEFFTFGSDLEVILEPDVLVYSFESPAPILELTAQEETIPDQLAYEVEALIAELEEKWQEERGEGFEQQLTNLDSVEFYAASLNALLHRYEESSALREAYPDFYRALRREKRWLESKDRWSKEPQSLKELLFSARPQENSQPGPEANRSGD